MKRKTIPVATPRGFVVNPNTFIGVATFILAGALGTLITHKVNTALDHQETNAKVIAEVPAKIESVKTEVSHKQELASLQVGQVQKDLTNLALDVKEGKSDLKEVKESQSKMITRDELNAKINVLNAVQGISEQMKKEKK